MIFLKAAKQNILEVTFTTTDDLNEFFQHEQIILIKWKRLHYNKPSSFSKKLKGEKKIFLNFPPFALRPGKTFLLHSSGRNKDWKSPQNWLVQNLHSRAGDRALSVLTSK